MFRIHFSVLDNRINIGNWAIESDIMDKLYSLGIVGFVLYYTFLSKILIRGYKIDKNIPLLLWQLLYKDLDIMFSGITYF